MADDDVETPDGRGGLVATECIVEILAQKVGDPALRDFDLDGGQAGSDTALGVHRGETATAELGGREEAGGNGKAHHREPPAPGSAPFSSDHDPTPPPH